MQYNISNNMLEKTPPHPLVLKAFTPTAESVCSGRLLYSPALDKETGKILDERQHQQALQEAEAAEDVLATQSSRAALAKLYMVHAAFRMTEQDASASIKQGWADVFTRESIEVYGRPDASFAEALASEQFTALSTQGVSAPDKLAEYQTAACAVGVEPSVAPCERESSGLLREFEAARLQMHDYFMQTYGDVYKEMGLSEHEGRCTPEDIAVAFEKGLETLAQSDSAWQSWQVKRVANKDALSVGGGSVNVGMRRASAAPRQVEGLFAHEVLRHALTAVNGKKIDARLGKGLPNYLDFEEGMGVFYEYAVTGALKDELVDRYVDVALALGKNAEGESISRQQLLTFAMAREQLRNEIRPDEDRLTDADLVKKVYAHINRIYRGTPGDDTIGVFTKDIAYLEGFMRAGRYINDQLASGMSIADIVTYTTQGKFDPTNAAHVAYIEGLRKPTISQELVPVAFK